MALVLLIASFGVAAVGIPSPAGATATTGSISGTVIGPKGPLAGVSVSADAYNVVVPPVTTDALGHYTIDGLAPDAYLVQFTAPPEADVVDEYFKNVHHDDHAPTQVVVVAGATSANINASLEPASHIMGVVVGPGGAALAEPAAVCINPTGPVVGGFSPPGATTNTAAPSVAGLLPYGCAPTDAAGRYDISLAAGSYTVGFSPAVASGLALQYFDNAMVPVAPTPLVVGTGATIAGVNARLRPAVQCGTFGDDCPKKANGSGCVVVTQIGFRTARFEYKCTASVIQWTSNNNHSVIGNPADLTFSGAGPWSVAALATYSSSPLIDYVPIQFPAGVAATVPGPPTSPLALTSVEQAKVSWAPPVSSGGSPVTSYLVTASPGGRTCTWTTGPLSCDVTGLAPGTLHTFTVQAANEVGAGATSVVSNGVTPTARRFGDVPYSHPFYGDIEWLAAQGITNGYPDGTFRGSQEVARQAMAAFLYRIAGSPNGLSPTCGAAPFTDVPEGAPFCGEITWLKGSGVTNGYPDGSFHPTGNVSRGAMAAFLYRFSTTPLVPAPACAVAPFTDVLVGAPFCAEITWLKGTGITSGYPDGTFRSGNNVSREAMAAFLHRRANL